MPAHTLHNRTFIITGAASGIGLALARALHEQGARLALWDVNAAALDAIGAELNVFTVCVDVTDAVNVEEGLQSSLAHLGRLDGVIHSAGILITGNFNTIAIETYARMVNINLLGSIMIARAVYPHLAETRGSLVLLGSISAFVPAPDFAVYATSKAGVYSLAQTLRIEWAKAGIHVGIANPLYVNTPMLTPENRAVRAVQSQSPFLAFYEADDVARSIVRGIERRQFMIWTGVRPRLIYWISRYFAWLTPWLTRRTWEEK
jgi:NAD(P)-dependent dehydrogenase (short-subunit alcohol dehydrogenase family)